MKNKNPLIACTAFSFIIILLFFGESFSSGIKKGLYSCSGIIIPSLFPFMVASSLAAFGDFPKILKKIIDKPMKEFFSLPSDSLSAIILGIIGGYPVGAKTVNNLCACGKISTAQAKKLILFCVNSGAGFAINALGSGILLSRQSGRLVFISGSIASIITGLITSLIPQRDEKSLPCREKNIAFSKAVVNSVTSGATGILAVCGFVCVFSGIAEIISSFHLNENIKTAVICLLEITSGCMAAAPRLSLPLVAAITAFGGLCVHMQVFAVCESFKPDISLFFLFRIIHSAFSALICKILLFFFPVTSEVFLALSENAAPWSFSAPSAISLLFLSALLILDLDTNRKIC